MAGCSGSMPLCVGRALEMILDMVVVVAVVKFVVILRVGVVAVAVVVASIIVVILFFSSLVAYLRNSKSIAGADGDLEIGWGFMLLCRSFRSSGCTGLVRVIGFAFVIVWRAFLVFILVRGLL